MEDIELEYELFDLELLDNSDSDESDEEADFELELEWLEIEELLDKLEKLLLLDDTLVLELEAVVIEVEE